MVILTKAHLGSCLQVLLQEERVATILVGNALLPVPTRVNIVAGEGEQDRGKGPHGAGGWQLLQA